MLLLLGCGIFVEFLLKCYEELRVKNRLFHVQTEQIIFGRELVNCRLKDAVLKVAVALDFDCHDLCHIHC